MKKIVALLLAVVLALAVSGCAESLKEIEIPPLPVITPTPAPDFSAPSHEPETETPEPSSPESEPSEPSPGPADPDAAAGDEPEDPNALPGNEPEPATGQQPPQTGYQVIIPVASSSPSPAPVQEATSAIVVSIERAEENVYDPEKNEILILSFSYDETRVRSDENPAAAERINEWLGTVEEAFYMGSGTAYGLNVSFLGYDNLLTTASDNYQASVDYQNEDLILEMSDSLSAEVTRLDEGMFSLLYTDSANTGRESSDKLLGASFDMSTGEHLVLDRLSDDPEGLEDSLVQIMQELVQEDPDGYFASHIQKDYLPAGGMEEAFRMLLKENNWYFDLDGMVIYSKRSQLGPDEAGITEFHIPYARLEGKLKEAYLFPADRTGDGSLSVSELGRIGGSLPFAGSVLLDPNGQQLALVVEGQIYDLRITRVFYSERFYEIGQLWAASSLADCAVQLQTLVPEGMPNLRISFTTADGQRFSKLLRQNGMDGSFLLVDDNIQAVG